MNQKRQAVQTRWLDTRQPAQRTGNEAVIFSDECWAGGFRLAASPAVHYELVMATIRRTLIN
ncbi:Uncharacterised protein [Klebsiella quasipneumoniae]|uniref:hypothetical protein n=1 Tax=Klebsiella pneumoniae complex TaxID=3390273 RepID=UPI000D74331B|nr:MULTISPECIES: hypothetical protein [Klebsiella]HCM7833994.1 hypothetical protein [Klebsiella quasipneumoniae subsp. quasipneumoniae]HDU4452001.1 hypothetical protein [Klebsiella pneumoniae subsp. pneumoniae]PXK48798.1 hypothetical protein DMR84_27575 [Klebsiella variicola]WPG80642.1 hypothetical protein SG622_26555 [Klebsiella pneumoniae]WPG85998.1 hypothetical protein SG621_26760 [Klebsiella pneumoniae]